MIWFILFSLPLLSSCWWDVGHMLTAQIAELRLNQLDPFSSVKFRQLIMSINSLVDERSRTFVESACWADDIKGNNYRMDIWNEFHFIDTPYIAGVLVPIVNYTEAAMSSISMLLEAKKVLTKNLLNVTAERALYARYLVHMVGDVHQPLHSVALFNETYPKGDQGGNLLKIKLLNGSLANFHSFWDSGGFRIQNDTYKIDRPMDNNNRTMLKNIASGMIKQYGDSIEELSHNINPVAWAKQSYDYAMNVTYPFMSQTNAATEAYTALVYETSRKRITLAGYRLANYIIDLYQNHTVLEKEPNIETIWSELMKTTEPSLELPEIIEVNSQ